MPNKPLSAGRSTIGNQFCQFIWLKILFAILFGIASQSCEPGGEESPLNTRMPDTNLASKDASLQSIADSLIMTDASGATIAVKGYKNNSAVDPDGDGIAANDLTNPSLQDESVFDFLPPENVMAEYSSPLISGGSGPASTANVSYAPKPSTLGGILLAAKESGLCGELAVNFIIKLVSTGYTSGDIRTPPLRLEMPCPSESFAGAGFVIEGGAAATRQQSVQLALSAGRFVRDMYITNLPGCSSGGSWESYQSEKKDWSLPLSDAENTIYVAFKDVVDHVSECFAARITHDQLAPTGVSVSIAGGALQTASQQVNLSLSASGASFMYITNTAACAADGSWEAYVATKSWTLGLSNGSTSVYVRYKDLAGNESACTAANIIHDNIAPTSTSITIDGGAAHTKLSNVQLTLAAVDASSMYVSNTAGCTSNGSWETYSASKAWVLGTTNATATVYVKFRDTAGNESACINDSLIHDDTPPSATSLTIAGGAATTTTTNVTLNLAALGASEVYVTNTVGCSSSGSWQPYASTTAWVLAESNTSANVYAKYRDEAGNESPCLSATIIHDDTPPDNITVEIAGGSLYTNSAAVFLTLLATDAQSMYVTNTAGCSTGGSWEPLVNSRAWTLNQTNATANIYAKFRDAAGNVTTCFNASIIHDNLAPSGESLLIDGGSTNTTSTAVTLSLTASGASQMYVTDDASCTAGGVWETYVTSKSWSLSQPDATSTVYVLFKDAAGNTSSCASDSIVHSSTGPTGISISIDAGAASSATTSVTLTLAASNANDMYITNTAACGSGGSWEAFATSKAWTLGQTNSTATVYAIFKDVGGNLSSCTSDTIVHDDIPPTSPSISIAGGANYTTTTNISLTLAATGASQMYISNSAGCSSGGSWEAYATTKPWVLGQLNSTATVYVKYIDSTGNETSCLSDTIIHDDTAPTATSISIAGGASYTSSASVSLSLAASGATDMYISNTAACGSGGSWEAYATSKVWTLGQTNTSATVYIKYRDAAGNESSCINDAIIHDNIAPSSPSLSIDSAATYATTTAVNLTLAAVDASDMYITNTAACSSGGSWASYASSEAWTLGQTNAIATVYVKYKDLAGNESSCVNDTITHDDTPPSATTISIAAGAQYTSSTSVTLTLSATSANQMYLTNTLGCSSSGSWEAYATTKAWSLAQTNATATVYIKYRDAAGNESSCINDTITHDNIAPSSTNISINAGAAYANSSSVTLTLAATDASDMYVTNTATCSGEGSWEAYAPSKAWTLGQSNTTATVYIKYRDAAGNESACINDTIVHDSIAPTGGSISISSGSATTTSSSVSLGLAASGADSMYVTNTAACSAGGSWEAYATTKAGWSLSQTNATATVYVKYRDTALNETSCYSDTIVHDNQPPTTPGSFADGTTSSPSAPATPTFSWTAASDSGSGIAYYEAAVGTSSGGTQILSWTNVGNTTSTTLSDLNLATGATYYGSIRAVDQAGNPGTQASGDGFIVRPWMQQAFIKAANAQANDEFGIHVSLYGDTMAASAHREDSAVTTITNGTTASTDDSASAAGAVYVYQRSGTTWAHQAYIKASNAKIFGFFGMMVSLSNNSLAVGAQAESSNQTTITNGTTSSSDESSSYSGAVYVYARTASNWAQQAYIKAVNNGSNDRFSRVSLDDDTLAVGAINEDSIDTTITNGTTASTDNSRSDVGAVYVYKRTATSWAQQGFIKPVNGSSSDFFGTSVALSSGTLAVGIPGDDSGQTTIINGTTASTDSTSSGSGGIFIYKRTGALWAQEAFIKASNNGSDDNLGQAVALSGDTLAAGAPFEDGSVTTVTNGTSANTSNSSSNSGAVYVYKRTGTSWLQEAYIKASNNDSLDEFGTSVALSGDLLAVAAPFEDSSLTTISNGTTAISNNGTSNSGAVYMYRRTAANWQQEAYIKPGNADVDDEFGWVALSNETLAVSAYKEDSFQSTITNGTTANTNNGGPQSGVVYIYTR